MILMDLGVGSADVNYHMGGWEEQLIGHIKIYNGSMSYRIYMGDERNGTK